MSRQSSVCAVSLFRSYTPSLRSTATAQLIEKCSAEYIQELMAHGSLYEEVLYANLVSLLLTYVVQGNECEAEKLVLIKPDLMLAKTDVSDYSQRWFEQISAIQYASWAYDTYMLNMLLSHLPVNKSVEALQQLDPADEKNAGVIYKFIDRQTNQVHTTQERHFNFSLLIRALRACCANQDYPALNAIQQMLPVHVVNEYCHPSRSFDPTPQFNEDRLPRSLEFHQDTNTQIAFWFPLSASHLSADKDFTIVRAGWRLYAFGGHKASARYEVDLAAMIALSNTRYLKLEQLIQQLKQQTLESQQQHMSEDQNDSCLVM